MKLSARYPAITVAVAAAVLMPGSLFAATANLAVTSVVSEIVGTTAVVTGSGSADNTALWSLNDSARFILSGDDGTLAANPVSYGLDISVIGSTGSLLENTDSMMIARTVDSQGLTDDGTISIYMRNSGSTEYTATLRFSWFDTTFSTPQAPDFNVTSLDLDFGQVMILEKDELTSASLNTPTDVVMTQTADSLFFAGNGTAAVSDPEAAVLADYTARSTFDVTFNHDSVALYMLEFRNPSSVLTDTNFETQFSAVPLPAGLSLMLVSGAALGGVSACRAKRARRAA